ncbi:MAG: hypothetical protein KatS3mg120_0215 [Erythrobacter sp.]|nr:MAG: hypothetical protein KatS3mg120_0215 [Erythrobacter sp.]
MLAGRIGLIVGALGLLGLGWALLDFTATMIGWLQPEARAGASTITVINGALASTMGLIAAQWLGTAWRPTADRLSTARFAALIPLVTGGLMAGVIGLGYEPALLPLVAGAAGGLGAWGMGRSLPHGAGQPQEG